MSSIPKPDKKPKYNQNKPYEWVDSQWEKLMTKQKELEDEITNLTGKIKNDMDYIKMLEGLISMCPMIGLLGTVYGMIEVFEVLSFLGTGNPRAMSSGVAMATIPTMSGMVITLFGLYFYQDLNGRINSLSNNFKSSLKNQGYKL